MKRVFEYFTSYDFFGYIFPGAIILSTLTFSYNLLKFVPSTDLTGLIVEAALFLGLSYIIGHVVQALAMLVDKKLVYQFLAKFPSSVLLLDENTHFSSQFKMKLRGLVLTSFNLPPEIEHQEMFNLCYTFVMQKEITTRVERFLGLYGFTRGLSFSFFFSALILSTNMILTQIMSIDIFILTISMILLAILFLNRHLAFGTRFVDAVYRDFYVFRIREG